MVDINPEAQSHINRIVDETTKSRGHLTSTLITLYSAFLAGIFLFVANTGSLSQFNDTDRRFLFATAIVCLLIIVVSVTEKFLSYLVYDKLRIDFWTKLTIAIRRRSNRVPGGPQKIPRWLGRMLAV